MCSSGDGIPFLEQAVDEGSTDTAKGNLRTEEFEWNHLEHKGECTVNWDRLEGQWKQQRGKAVYHWGRMMNDELSAILGKYEELVGRLQEKYGIAKDEARHRVDEYEIIVKQLRQANSKLIRLHKALSNKKKSDKRQTRVKALPRKRK